MFPVVAAVWMVVIEDRGINNTSAVGGLWLGLHEVKEGPPHVQLCDLLGQACGLVGFGMPHLLISVLLLLMHTFSWGAF
jgi:hypothetical protein